jgi:transposase
VTPNEVRPKPLRLEPRGIVPRSIGAKGKRMAADGFNENGEVVVPDCVRGALRPLVGQIDALDEAIGAIDRELAASVKADETANRLMTIPAAFGRL